MFRIRDECSGISGSRRADLGPPHHGLIRLSMRIRWWQYAGVVRIWDHCRLGSGGIHPVLCLHTREPRILERILLLVCRINGPARLVVALDIIVASALRILLRILSGS